MGMARACIECPSSHIMSLSYPSFVTTVLMVPGTITIWRFSTDTECAGCDWVTVHTQLTARLHVGFLPDSGPYAISQLVWWVIPSTISQRTTYRRNYFVLLIYIFILLASGILLHHKTAHDAATTNIYDQQRSFRT